MGPHFMLLLSICVLYSNVTYIYPVLCLVEIKLFQIVSNLHSTPLRQLWQIRHVSSLIHNQHASQERIFTPSRYKHVLHNENTINVTDEAGQEKTFSPATFLEQTCSEKLNKC